MKKLELDVTKTRKYKLNTEIISDSRRGNFGKKNAKKMDSDRKMKLMANLVSFVDEYLFTAYKKIIEASDIREKVMISVMFILIP